MNYKMDNKAAITTQPYSQFTGGDGSNWVQNPNFTSGYSGFEYLRNADQLFVTYKTGLKDDGCCEELTTTTISNSFGQPVYFGFEEASCCSRACEGPGRAFNVKIKDGRDNEIGQFLRDTSCALNCCPCCVQRLEIYAPVGNLIGVARQDFTFTAPNYSIRTPGGERMFDITIPSCFCNCSGSITYQILKGGEQMQIGTLTRHARAAKELPVEGECYHITFPSTLEINQKVALIGGVYLMDFVIYDRNRREDTCI